MNVKENVEIVYKEKKKWIFEIEFRIHKALEKSQIDVELYSADKFVPPFSLQSDIRSV